MFSIYPYINIYIFQYLLMDFCYTLIRFFLLSIVLPDNRLNLWIEVVMAPMSVFYSIHWRKSNGWTSLHRLWRGLRIEYSITFCIDSVSNLRIGHLNLLRKLWFHKIYGFWLDDSMEALKRASKWVASCLVEIKFEAR